MQHLVTLLSNTRHPGEMPVPSCRNFSGFFSPGGVGNLSQIINPSHLPHQVVLKTPHILLANSRRLLSSLRSSPRPPRLRALRIPPIMSHPNSAAKAADSTMNESLPSAEQMTSRD